MEETALFVFIPFCKIKCTYCDFNVYANLSRVMEPYADAVAREIECVGAIRRRSPLPAKSIYLGGGTPSMVPVQHIEKILNACAKSFSISPDTEITLEANPGTMDPSKLCDLRALGVNRLSIGVQAFDDATLKRLNRGHTVADALKTYDDSRRARFDNINLDFIYGLPLQTMEDWSATLTSALALAPDHLSLYALKVEEKTGLEFQIKRGKYPMPDDDLAADMYGLAEEKLEATGYEHYEISNWARRLEATPRQSRHNLTYWLNQPYLGFGAGAHSYFNGSRYRNVLPPLDYIARVKSGETVVGGAETIDRATEMAETMILGLRLSRGVAFSEFQRRFDEDARVKYAVQIAELKNLGLLEWSDEVLRLTSRGKLLSNEVFWRFLP